MPRSSTESVIRKWGNRPALLLPTSALEQAGYRLGQKVEVTVSRGRIVIQPLAQLAYDLDELVKGITDANSHGEISFGGSAGKEAL